MTDTSYTTSCKTIGCITDLPDAILILAFTFVINEYGIDFVALRAVQQTCKQFRILITCWPLWRPVPLVNQAGLNRHAFKELETVGKGTEGIRKLVFCRPRNEVCLMKCAVNQVTVGNVEGVPYHWIRGLAIHKRLLCGGPSPFINSMLVASVDATRMYSIFPFAELSLHQFFQSTIPEKQINRRMCLDMMDQVMAGLQHCHSRAVAHRNVKPQHILMIPDASMRSTFRLQLADFSMARIIREGLSVRQYTCPVTSLWYRAPEVLLGDTRYTTAIDIWSAGCVWVEMCRCGVPLFRSHSEIEQLFLIFNACGTPDDNSWHAFSELPYFSDAFPVFLPKPLPIPNTSDEIVVRSLLCCSPSSRASASTAKKAIEQQLTAIDESDESDDSNLTKRRRVDSRETTCPQGPEFLDQIRDLHSYDDLFGVVDHSHDESILSLALISLRMPLIDWLYRLCAEHTHSNALADNCMFLCLRLMESNCACSQRSKTLASERDAHVMVGAIALACFKVANKYDSVVFCKQSKVVNMLLQCLPLDITVSMEKIIVIASELEISIVRECRFILCAPTIVDYICLFLSAISSGLGTETHHLAAAPAFALGWLSAMPPSSSYSTLIDASAATALWCVVQEAVRPANLAINCVGFLNHLRVATGLRLIDLVPCMNALVDAIADLLVEQRPSELQIRLADSLTQDGFGHWQQKWWTQSQYQCCL